MADLTQLKLLISLAQIDGQVAEREQLYIAKIAAAHGIKAEEITPLFDQQHTAIVPTNLNDEERFKYIFSLVRLMKIDERLYNDEIRYCGTVAAKLGYDPRVMAELMLNVRGGAMEPAEIDVLKAIVARYRK